MHDRPTQAAALFDELESCLRILLLQGESLHGCQATCHICNASLSQHPYSHGVGSYLRTCEVFTQGTAAQVPLGHTIARRQLLRAKGWTMMSVAGYEWRRICHSLKLRREYVQHLVMLHAYELGYGDRPDCFLKLCCYQRPDGQYSHLL